jgi:prolyl oligopeptidase
MRCPPRFAAPAAIAIAIAATFAAASPAPPPTRVDVVRDTLHGTVLEDPYRWLEDKDAPETRAWLDAQNAYTRSVLDALPGRAALRARFEALHKVDLTSVPVERGGRYFFSRRGPDQEQRVLYVRRGRAGEDEVLLDPHPLSPDRTTSVVLLDVIRDGSLAAIGTRLGGADELEVSFLDVDTRQPLPDRLPRERYFGIALTPDRKGFYYSKFLPEGSRVYYHAMGTDPSSDPVVFGEGYGPEKIIDVALSEDGRWLTATVYYGSAAERSELWVRDVAAGGPFVAIARDIEAFFGGTVAGDVMYVQTNWKAPKSRILRIDLRDPAPEKWREVVPETAHVLEGFSLAGGRLFVNYLENVVSKVRIFAADGRALGEIGFPTLGSVGTLNGRWDSDEAFFTFASFTVPTTIFRYDIAHGQRSVWWRSQAPVRSGDFETRQVWITSKDGTKVPMFLVHKRGLRFDGKRPTFLYGYGGFLVNETPKFSPDAVQWAENGGVFALPNLRGGGEFGEAWHKAGMLDRKQNTFDDFIAAAEWLIANRVTNPDRLAIGGGSNGGLLVGAALTQRPELFRAVYCGVPLLDMVRFHRFLVARFWVPEYGSSENPEQFAFLRAYSPYHRVTQGIRYPAVIFVTGDSDTRVDPLHARKMAALLQASTGSDPARSPVVLHYDTKAGHSGGKPVSKQIEDDTDELLFLFGMLGVTPAGSPIDSPVGGTMR